MKRLLSIFSYCSMSTLVLLSSLPTTSIHAHPDHHAEGHRGPTYEVTAPARPDPNARRLVLRVLDDSTGELTAARVSMTIDGEQFIPHAVSEHGLRFVSIHTAKKQRATVIYARGSGPVELSLPADAKQCVLVATKGYEFLPSRVRFKLGDEETSVTVRLKRWSTIRDDGWMPAEEHLHYERIDPKHDADWLNMLAAEDLTHAHFMVLKGGNLPGIWAQQYAYGKRGQATDGRRLLVPGEEFRDSRQGHINLLGIGEVIEPISIGGIGKPPHPFNYPALHDVFLIARRSGGIGGPAHGGALARNSTAIVDTVLGVVEFFEIANTHLYKTDVWYRLMNCGFIVPPAAGTDLPNFPFRDNWQPLLGETRMYVRVGEDRDFESWKQAIRRGEVFISSGPIVQLKINGVGPGGVVQLPAGGGDLEIQAELSCSQPLQSFEVIRNGSPIDLKPKQQHAQAVHRWEISGRITVRESCWIAARGSGVRKRELERSTGIQQDAISHTSAIRIIVNGQPITSTQDASVLVSELTASQQAYRTDGKFQRVEDRARLLELFDKAIQTLEQQTQSQGR